MGQDDMAQSQLPSLNYHAVREKAPIRLWSTRSGVKPIISSTRRSCRMDRKVTPLVKGMVGGERNGLSFFLSPKHWAEFRW